MWQLYQFALCPFGRLVRLLLGEKRVAYELAEVTPCQHDTALHALNPLRCTPVLHDGERCIVLAGSGSIAEYLEETVLAPSLLQGSAEQRAETRRLVAWAADCFYRHVSRPLLQSRVFAAAHGSVDVADSVAMAMDELFGVLAFHLDERAWLAGPTLSLADLAIAAQVSVADYFGAISWLGHDDVRVWYSTIKSRRSFQPLLADRVPGLTPPPHYADQSF